MADPTESRAAARSAAANWSLLGVGSGVVLVVASAAMGRGMWFFSDEWNILVRYPRLGRGLLEPFNGHLSLLPAGWYQVLFHTVGVEHYLPYRIVGWVGLAVLAFQAHRWTAAQVAPGWAALATALVMWNSGGVTNVMFPFLINFSLPIAALIAIWRRLDRNHRRDDWWAAGWLAVALATSGLGVLVVGAVGVELLLRRVPVRRWVPFAPPTGLWLVWFLTHRIETPGSHGLRAVVSYAARILWGGFTSVAGNSKPAGALLAGVTAAAVVAAVVRTRRLDPRLFGALAVPVLFAGLTAYTRLNITPPIPPDEYRYRWTVGVTIVLAMVALGSLAAFPLRSWMRWGAGVMGSIALAAGAVHLVSDMDAWATTVRAAAPGLRSVLFATEAAGSRLPRSTRLPLSYVPVTAGEYLNAVDVVGSPLDGAEASMVGGSDGHRDSADHLLLDHGLTFLDEPGSVTVCAEGQRAVAVTPGSTVWVTDTQTVRISRFSQDGVTVTIPAGQLGVRIPADDRTRAWAPDYRVEALDGSGVRLCS